MKIGMKIAERVFERKYRAVWKCFVYCENVEGKVIQEKEAIYGL